MGGWARVSNKSKMGGWVGGKHNSLSSKKNARETLPYPVKS